MSLRSPLMHGLGVVVATLSLAVPTFAQSQADLIARSLPVLGVVCASPVNNLSTDPNVIALVATTCDISGLVTGSPEQNQATLFATPREATAASSTATQTTTTQVESQKTRLEEARLEPSAAGDSEKRFGGFLNGSGGFGEVDDRGEAEGYDVQGGGVNAGIDYRFNDQFVGGVGFGWNRQNTEFDDQAAANGTGASVGGGEIDSDSFTPSLYGSFFQGPLYVDGVLTYTFVDYEFERAVDQLDVGTPFRATARGDTDAHQFGASIGGGYAFELGGLSIGPAAQFNYLVTSIDGYTESGVPGIPLKYDDQTVRSVLTSVGAEASYAISTPIGVLVPHVRGSWEHEFENDARSIDARLVNNIDTGINDNLFTRTERPDRDYARVGGGVSAQLQGGFAAFVDYDAIVGLSDVEYHRFTAGGRMEF